MWKLANITTSSNGNIIVFKGCIFLDVFEDPILGIENKIKSSMSLPCLLNTDIKI